MIASATSYDCVEVSPDGAGVGFLFGVIDGGEVGVEVGGAVVAPVEPVVDPAPPPVAVDALPALEPEALLVLALDDVADAEAVGAEVVVELFPANGSRPRPGSLE